MADARICDCCRQVFGSKDDTSKPKYRLFVRNDRYDYFDDRNKSGMSEYNEPELCPECKQALFDLIHNSKFAKIGKENC